MICVKCGNEVGGANFCSECGANMMKEIPLPINNENYHDRFNEKLYKSIWFTILMLIVFFPVGIVLMRASGKFNKTLCFAITLFFGLIILFGFFN